MLISNSAIFLFFIFAFGLELVWPVCESPCNLQAKPPEQICKLLNNVKLPTLHISPPPLMTLCFGHFSNNFY